MPKMIMASNMSGGAQNAKLERGVFLSFTMPIRRKRREMLRKGIAGKSNFKDQNKPGSSRNK